MRNGREQDFARDDAGGAAIETALVLALSTIILFVVKTSAIEPMLQRFVEAANILSRALS